MKRSPHKVVWTIYAVLVLVLAARVAWVVSRAETGWETLQLQWRDATLGWFVGRYVPVRLREPVDQAEFWLAETERILDHNPDDAALLMGAACVLDAPMVGFFVHYVTPTDFDYDALQQAEDKFEKLCRERCLALAARATELEPSNVNWWQCRAFLQLQESWGGLTPRDSDWQEMIEECANHDPDNALYDYLIARYLWRTSSEIEYEAEPNALVINDTEWFEQGVIYFEQGVQKSRFDVDDPELIALRRFLAHSRLSLIEHTDVLADRPSAMLGITMPRYLLRARLDQANMLAANGDPGGAVDALQQTRRLVEQTMSPTGPETSNRNHLSVQCMAAGSLHEFVQKHPGLVSPDEEKRVLRDCEETISAIELRQAADWNVQLSRTTKTSVAIRRELVGFVVDAAAIPLLVVVAVFILLVTRRMTVRQRSESHRLGFARHAVAWIAGFGIVFVVFALAPAEIISHAAQGSIVLILAAAFVMTCLLMLIWFARAGKFQFSLRTLMVFSFGVAVVCSLISWSGCGMEEIDRLPDSIHVPARGWQVCSAKVSRELYLTQYGRWSWIALQWWSYSGLAVSGLAALGIIAFWHVWRAGRLNGKAASRYWFYHPRQHLGGTLLEVRKSATALAACCLLIHLTAVPIVIEDAEAQFQEYMAWVRNPEQYNDLLRTEIAKIKADPVQMEAIRATVKERTSSTYE